MIYSEVYTDESGLLELHRQNNADGGDFYGLYVSFMDGKKPIEWDNELWIVEELLPLFLQKDYKNLKNMFPSEWTKDELKEIRKVFKRAHELGWFYGYEQD